MITLHDWGQAMPTLYHSHVNSEASTVKRTVPALHTGMCHPTAELLTATRPTRLKDETLPTPSSSWPLMPSRQASPSQGRLSSQTPPEQPKQQQPRPGLHSHTSLWPSGTPTPPCAALPPPAGWWPPTVNSTFLCSSAADRSCFSWPAIWRAQSSSWTGAHWCSMLRAVAASSGPGP